MDPTSTGNSTVVNSDAYKPHQGARTAGRLIGLVACVAIGYFAGKALAGSAVGAAVIANPVAGFLLVTCVTVSLLTLVTFTRMRQAPWNIPH